MTGRLAPRASANRYSTVNVPAPWYRVQNRVQRQGAETGCRDRVQSLLKEGKHRSAPRIRRLSPLL
jgi:hypothetical protein